MMETSMFSLILSKFSLLFCLAGPSFAKVSPDVDCIVLHFERVQCTWNRLDNLSVNYTFFSWFHGKEARECELYLRNYSINSGCLQPYGEKDNRFMTFYTRLVYNNDSFDGKHDLLKKVKLNPPTNLTVQNGSDLNLWFYWNHSDPKCIQNEVRYRTNNKKWDAYTVTPGKQNYCINLPSSRSRYELQVRSRIDEVCAASDWSDWSKPVFWGSYNSTDIDPINGSMFVWIILYVLAPVILILLVMLLLRYERFRVIFIHVVPKPSLIPQDIEPWLKIPKGLQEGFKANYHEQACPVREYRH
ncbi:cytokine receptor common subunit gamma-like [Stigmatopora nigra]